MAFVIAAFAEDAGSPRLSPECHKFSHENNPTYFWPSAPTPRLDPFQRAGVGVGGGQAPEQRLRWPGHIFLTTSFAAPLCLGYIGLCHPPSQSHSSSSELRLQPHRQRRRLSICITKWCIWLVFPGKQKSLLKWMAGVFSSCQTNGLLRALE